MKPQAPLVFSTMCQRVSMGTFIMALACIYLFDMALPINVVALVTIVILGVGMLGTMSHLGKPGRFLNSFNNPRSHLTQEGILTIVVGLCYVAIGGDGLVYSLPEGVLPVLEVIGAVSSVLYIYVTAMAYRMKARPAWDTFATPMNFILTFLSAGAMGAYAFATVLGVSVPLSFLVVIAVLFVASVAGQLYFTNYVGHVGNRVDVDPFDGEYRTFYVPWLITGIAIPLVALIIAFVMPDSAVVSIVLLLSEAVSLICWQAFFFLSGREVWYFPQYDKDLSPNY